MAGLTYTFAFGATNRPLRISSVEIKCFILQDGRQVLSKSGVQKALGYDGKAENWLYDLLNHIRKFYPTETLMQKLEQPLCTVETPGSARFVGIEPLLLVEICQTLVFAKEKGYLNVNQLKYSRAAEKILQSLSGKNINALVEEATGFRFYKEQSIENLEIFLFSHTGDMAFRWIRTVPESFFEKLFALHASDWRSLRSRPKAIGKILYDIVFSRLPNDLIATLRDTPPKRLYRRKNYEPQDNQHPQLKLYLEQLQALFEASGNNWNIFLQLLQRSFPKNAAYETRFPVLPEAPASSDGLSEFNALLKKMS